MICSTCKQDKETSEFHKNRKSHTGFHNICKVCRSAEAKKPENLQKSKEARWRREGGPKPPRAGWIENEIGYIPLTQDQVALVDPDDVPWLSQWNWNAAWVPSVKNYYANRGQWDGTSVRYILMHRLILGILDSPLNGDHKNHNTLDNRRSNLRIATISENNRNSRRTKQTISGLRGARWDKHSGKYRSDIWVDGERIYLGCFETPEEAHKKYLEAAELHHGQFAYAGSEEQTDASI